MCFFINNQLTKKQIKDNYDAHLAVENFSGTDFLNGFSHPNTPIILEKNQEIAVLGNWGLLPSWAKDKSLQKNTLNAKIESVKEKHSFRNAHQNRCLVLVKGFYEWKWLDEKGKNKEKNFISLEGQDAFALGGIYTQWFDPTTNEDIITFSIITTQANELMSKIHNTKKRMPVILDRHSQNNWLQKNEIMDFAYPQYDIQLVSTVV